MNESKKHSWGEVCRTCEKAFDRVTGELLGDLRWPVRESDKNECKACRRKRKDIWSHNFDR